ncbi:MAG: hypothetical protein KKB37_00335 [Alphaproteobacteria bacterium]|nr:hypothetical protein [Alphaproteobacteria bacterium]
MRNCPFDLQHALEHLAAFHLAIPTMKTRNRDDLDFHEVAVWDVADALTAAYRLGQINPEQKDIS